jgi:hypothetical protein
MSLALFLSGFAFSDELAAESKWAASPPTVDGLASEWPSDNLYFYKDLKIEYAFRNDGRNLYVLFVFKDPKSLSTVGATGMTVYCGLDGKKKKYFGVRFIKKNVTTDEYVTAMAKRGEPVTEEKLKELWKERQHFLLEANAVNRKGEVISSFGPGAGPEPPAFDVTRQGTVVTYEFRIPLSSRELFPSGMGAEPGKNLDVGLEWGGLTKIMERAMANSPGPSSSTAGRGDAPPEPFGETPAQKQLHAYDAMSSPYGSSTKKHSIWVRLKLAQKQ